MQKARSSFESDLLLTDEEILELGVPEHSVELYRRSHYTSSYGISSWYDDLKEHTFKTVFVDLTFDEAGAILSRSYNKTEATQDELDTLEHLKEKIDEALEQFPNGAFMKLNTRSPKDVPVYATKDEQLKELLKEELTKVTGLSRDSVKEVNAFIIATNKYMKISTSDDALQLLLTSSRVSQDLSRDTQFGQKLFKNQLIFREWLDEVPIRPQFEFRCFAHNKELHAMTQYFDLTAYPELIERKDELERLVLDFFESIKDKIQQNSFVIDFFITSDNTVKIIELNPFHNGAGAGLFSWKEDREIFLNGPFEFRIMTFTKEDPMEKYLIPAWIRFIDAHCDSVIRKNKALFFTKLFSVFVGFFAIAYACFS